MKRNKLLILVMTLFLGVSLVLMAQSYAQADPPPNTSCVAQCNGPVGDFFPSKGSCVSACNVCLNDGNNVPVCLCKQWKDRGLLDDFGFENQGECVAAFR